MLVLPGGGFWVHTEHEGAGYARWLSGIGVHTYVLRYRLLPLRFPAPLQGTRAGLERAPEVRVDHRAGPAGPAQRPGVAAGPRRCRRGCRVARLPPWRARAGSGRRDALRRAWRHAHPDGGQPLRELPITTS